MTDGHNLDTSIMTNGHILFIYLDIYF